MSPAPAPAPAPPPKAEPKAEATKDEAAALKELAAGCVTKQDLVMAIRGSERDGELKARPEALLPRIAEDERLAAESAAAAAEAIEPNNY